MQEENDDITLKDVILKLIYFVQLLRRQLVFIGVFMVLLESWG